MKIPCVSCQFMCILDNNLLNPTGSLVRCPECRFIFMVHRPNIADEPIAQDTKIDQSILNDFYPIRPELQDELPVDEISQESDDYVVQSLISIEELPDNHYFHLPFANSKFLEHLQRFDAGTKFTIN